MSIQFTFKWTRVLAKGCDSIMFKGQIYSERGNRVISAKAEQPIIDFHVKGANQEYEIAYPNYVTLCCCV